MKQNIGSVERMVSGAAGIALAALGVSRKGPFGLVLSAVGAGLVARGATGHCPFNSAAGTTAETKDAAPWNRKIRVKKSVTITKPRAEVYAFWRKLSNLPRFMRHLEQVREIDGSTSEWTAKAPAGRQVCWKAEILEDNPNESIWWRSLDGSDVPNEGTVTFEDAPGGRGTIVRVDLTYLPPAGVIGALFAKIMGEEPHGQIEDDLRRLRSILETGEVPTTDGQPSDTLRKTSRQIGTAPGAALVGKAMEREPSVR